MKWSKRIIALLGLSLVLLGADTDPLTPAESAIEEELIDVKAHAKRLNRAISSILEFAWALSSFVAGLLVVIVAPAWAKDGLFSSNIVLFALGLLVVALPILVSTESLSKRWRNTIESMSNPAHIKYVLSALHAQAEGIGRFGSAGLAIIAGIYVTGAFSPEYYLLLVAAVVGLSVLCFGFLIAWEISRTKVELEGFN